MTSPCGSPHWCASLGRPAPNGAAPRWFLIGAALVSWAIGDTIWSLRGDPTAAASISDLFWLAWYPLLIAALVLLVRDRVPAFELHRWIDGVVVMLLVATPWVALFLQPAAQSSNASTLTKVVDFAYPLGDAIIVGATLGVMALMGWRPGRMWIALGAAFAALGIADAVYSVDALGHTYSMETTFDALWLAGIALIAYAAWLAPPGAARARDGDGMAGDRVARRGPDPRPVAPGLRPLLRGAEERADLHDRRVDHRHRTDRRDAPTSTGSRNRNAAISRQRTEPSTRLHASGPTTVGTTASAPLELESSWFSSVVGRTSQRQPSTGDLGCLDQRASARPLRFVLPCSTDERAVCQHVAAIATSADHSVGVAVNPHVAFT